MSHRRRGHQSITTTYDATLLAADRILSKGDEYKKVVKRIHANACMLAEKISIHGDVQKALLQDDADHENNNAGKADEKKADDEVGAEPFLIEQRTKLKEFTAENVRRSQDLEYFLRALDSVRADVRAKQQVEEGNNTINGSGEEEHTTVSPDYTKVIQNKIDSLRVQSQMSDVSDSSVYDHQFCQEMRARLGEKEKRRKKSSSTRRSCGGDDDDEDELEIIPTQSTDSEKTLKCPITGTWYEKPLRNKLCKHVISTAGFELMSKTKKFACPVYGCTNKYTKDQLEDDIEMEMKVARHRTRMRREQELTQQNEESSGAEEEEEEANAKMTIIE